MPEDWQKRQKSANVIIDGPRAKSDAPRPPMGAALVQATDEALDRWGVEVGKWQEENKHLPNLPSVDVSVNGMKARRNQMQQQGAPGAPKALPANNAQLNTLDAKVQVLEVKLDRIISHFGVK